MRLRWKLIRIGACAVLAVSLAPPWPLADANEVLRLRLLEKLKQQEEAEPKPKKPTAPRRPATPAHDPAAHAHWDYEGEWGPERWGQMPGNALCAKGQRQSPIDIRDPVRVELEPLRFDYRPVPFAVTNNGHTIQVNFEPGLSIEARGRRYGLVQLHFHTPSEERIDGEAFALSVHLVHKDEDGRLAVVGVLMRPGADNPLLTTVWNNLPLETGETFQGRGQLDPSLVLPPLRGYYTYMGSLTTPPCSEGVLWLVMQQAQTLSPAQLAIFQRLYPMNARPIQPTSGRLIQGTP